MFKYLAIVQSPAAHVAQKCGKYFFNRVLGSKAHGRLNVICDEDSKYYEHEAAGWGYVTMCLTACVCVCVYLNFLFENVSPRSIYVTLEISNDTNTYTLQPPRSPIDGVH